MKLWWMHRRSRDPRAEVARLRKQLVEQGQEIRKLRDEGAQLRDEREQLLQVLERIGTAVAVVRAGLSR